MSTHATFGHMRTAAARKSSSGRVYSCAAAETMMTASAAASAAVVAAPCAEPRPPTPGVSTSTRPPASRVRGMPTSAWRRPDRLPGFPASDTYAASSRERDLGALRRAVAVADADQRDRRRVRVPDHGDHRRRDVVVDRTHGRRHQGVHQLALALLELPDHEHPHRRVRQPLRGAAQAGGEIGAVVGGGGFGRDLDERYRLGHGHVVPPRDRAAWWGSTAQGPVTSPSGGTQPAPGSGPC